MIGELDDKIPLQRHRLPHVEVYEVTGDELDHLEQLASFTQEDLTFATFAFSSGLSFGTTLLTVEITSTKLYVTYLVFAIVGLLLGVYFGMRWFFARRRSKKIIQRIKERLVGPLGEEGKELRPSELEALPAQEAKSPETPS